jgi:hypothetical protein
MRSGVFFGLGISLFMLVRAASAVTNEPDGSQVPRDSKNGEIQLYTLFQDRNDPVDWLADAHTTPGTFSPLCNFKATFVLHQAGSNPGVGWYNVDPAATAPPLLTDIHVIVPAGTAVGAVIDSATIKGDPAYKGGLIGFALMGSQPHFSEQKWNVSCLLCSSPGPWILSLTYQSKSTPDAYYLAFEDGNVDAFSFGNDGDFNDDVFFFEGLTCQGGGTPCDTGQPGACAAGLNECSATGLTCKAVVQPGVEKCNGVDDDCNGKTDDGDLCQPGFVCDRGTCVTTCNGSEFPCPGTEVCKDGYCVDSECEAVTCAEGTVCVAGVCKAPCDGIACPSPTVCRVGVCVDPCAGVECAPGSHCEGGICLASCDCSPCATGAACDPATERCVEPSCVGIPCDPGTRCVGGKCVDPCATAVCPRGQACTAGVCVTTGVADAGAGGSGGGARDGGGFFVGSGGDSTGAPSGGQAAVDAGSAVSQGGGYHAVPASPLGCSCRSTAGRAPGAAATWVVVAAVVGLGRRRRLGRGRRSGRARSD